MVDIEENLVPIFTYNLYNRQWSKHSDWCCVSQCLKPLCLCVSIIHDTGYGHVVVVGLCRKCNYNYLIGVTVNKS